ncbi:hypothetical protein BD779DRAFT_1671802 [Infundibulicybe gibba]|nr:hypothetical protein BD779DRAFT_1671802 [Infundibulicybe gibba]
MGKESYLQLVNLDPTGSIRPTTSRDTGRYSEYASVEPMHMQIAPGILADRESAYVANCLFNGLPNYYPPGLHIYHPIGPPTSIRKGNSISFMIQPFESLLRHQGVDVIQKHPTVATNAPQIELFIRIDGEDCTYYLVDHATRTEFWLDAYDTDDLNIAPVASRSHLKLALEELYWGHVENFPMHLGGLDQQSYDDLICVFSHAYADQMTSRLSTFPYSAPDCKKFLKLLEQSRGHIQDGRTTCFVARLWTIVVRHWFSTHFGQEHARLSRDQAILAGIPENHRWKGLISNVTLGTSDTYIQALDDLFVDHIVYATQWHPSWRLACETGEGSHMGLFWRSCMHLPFNLLKFIHPDGIHRLHGLVFYSQASPTLAAISGVLESASLASSLLLTHRHEPLENATASEALRYMSNVHSDQYGFQFVGLAYSLPKTFYFLGLIVFFANWVTVLNKYAGSLWTAGCLSALLVVFVAFQSVTSTRSWSMPSMWTQVFRFRSQTEIEGKSEESMV